jgi:hypothetical protein
MGELDLYNAVCSGLFEKTKNQIFGDSFPWYYVAATAYTKDLEHHETLHNGSFYHLAMNNGIKNSEIANTLEDCLLVAADKVSITVKKIHRIRIGMNVISDSNHINPPHVDMDFPHKVGLLYLNDSDGNTILYNEKYDINSNYDSSYYYIDYLKKKVTAKKQFVPVENKMIFFDGLTYHSSSTPAETKRRITVNYVFE